MVTRQWHRPSLAQLLSAAVSHVSCAPAVLLLSPTMLLPPPGTVPLGSQGSGQQLVYEGGSVGQRPGHSRQDGHQWGSRRQGGKDPESCQLDTTR